MIFSLITLAEYRWFLPKLVHYNGTQEHLSELTQTTFNADRYDANDWALGLMDMRNRRIWLHLLADPLIAARISTGPFPYLHFPKFSFSPLWQFFSIWHCWFACAVFFGV